MKVTTQQFKDQAFGESSEEMALNYLINQFAEQLRERVLSKLREGYTGWDNPDEVSTRSLEVLLRKNLTPASMDFIDVGVLAAMIWNRKNG
jgi:hypothetical protein